ncbi:MAG: ABC transporter ATP-binding protein [Phycisphaerales bacterium JB040]
MADTSASTTAETGAAPGGRTDRPIVACQRLTKVFRDFWMRPNAKAVDALDMLVYPKEIFGLLGPNGSGKSTTIKMILGLLRPTSGRVMVFGKPPTDVQTKKRIGYLPEESYLYPFLNARETLEYYAKLFEIDPKTRTRRIDELLDMVGLQHAQFRPVREYSKGMQRRIGIAQALINDPDLLILDEPTTGLDPIGTRQVKDLILELGRRGKTVILSSHLLADVEDVVDRMVILYGGRVRGEGTCDELLASHEKTTIETDALDEDTIAEIDRLIRERTGGEKSIRGVTMPRQKLEEFFLGIVERAQAERVATAGAVHSGGTAAFLKGEGETGEALISSLMTDREPEDTPEPDGPADTGPGPAGSDEGVIGSLLAGDTGDPAPSPERSGKPGGPSRPGGENAGVDSDDDEVDLGVIGSLMDDDEREEKPS